MSSKHLVHPEILEGLELLPKINFTVESLPAIREGMLLQLKEMGNNSEGAEISNIELTERIAIGSEGNPDVRVLVFTPKNEDAKRPVFLHIHGGGFFLGIPEMSNSRNMKLASELDCVVVSVDYRLAPETPYPGPLEDCYTALKWLHSNAADLGIDPNKIAIGGESAGGGIAACLALLARDRNEIPIVFQMLIYPMLDDQTGLSEDHNPLYGEFSWTPDNNRFGWEVMLGQAPGGNDVSQYAAAARADDLSNLPSTYISTGSLELFCEENIEYARRLIASGVLAELNVVAGTYHGFDAFVPGATISQDFEKSYFRALKNAFSSL